MKNIFNNIIINLICFKLFSAYLIFPFKTRKSQIPNTDKNISALFRSLIYNHIFIEVNIGSPKQNVEVFLRSTTTDFYISEKNKSDIKTSCPEPIIYDVGSDLDKFYDKYNSESLEITEETTDDYPIENGVGNVSYDIFNFIDNNKKLIDKKIKFVLYKSTLGYTPGVIGLEAVLESEDKKYNFVDQLKSNDIINSYFWMINYTSDYEGNFIVGEQPHVFDNYFDKEELSFSYPFLYDDFFDWGLSFDDISFNGVNFRQFHDTVFEYELNYIKGNIELERQLDIYFNESIKNKTCFKEYINYPYPPNIFYYCKKDLYEDNMKYFPSLRFFQYELNFTFELNYKDLFVDRDDKIILLIFFDNAKFDWHFGKPFLRKYAFLMNQDTKIIGFYKNKNNWQKNEDEKKEKDDMKKQIQIILFIILLVIVLVLLIFSGIFIGVYLFKKKRKSKYRIDEEFEYTAKKDEAIN